VLRLDGRHRRLRSVAGLARFKPARAEFSERTTRYLSAPVRQSNGFRAH
jgi:hypothetical protein